MSDLMDKMGEELAQDEAYMERKRRYDELAPQIKGQWGEKAIALFYEGEAVEFWAEFDTSQLVEAWPDWFDEPVLKTCHHQTLANEIRLEQDHDERELRIVDWGETPFPEEEREWPLV